LFDRSYKRLYHFNMNILFLSDGSDHAKSIFTVLSSEYSFKSLPYDAESVQKACTETSYKAFVIYNPGMTPELRSVLKYIQKCQTAVPALLLGPKSECESLERLLPKNTIHSIPNPASESDIRKGLAKFLSVLYPDEIKTDSREPAPEAHADSEEESDRRRKVILVVDDSAVFLRTMSNLLSIRYTVAVAKSGAAAITYLSTTVPDLILLDYEMPVCSGPQTLKMIRAEESSKNIPVFFLTGISDDEQVRSAMMLKPEGYILKSCAPEELLQRIAAFFTKKK
jgi:CheY-like chemotaxis protein